MHKRYNHQEFEKKWQEKWKQDGTYNIGARDTSKEKEYVLVELPYPSGNLHIGHWYAFAVPDIYVRYKRMMGKQVLYPMGFDAFGLPAENAAIKRNINPRVWTKSNIEYMRNQLDSMGVAFSWDKTTSTIDPEYYKWTQWMFTQFFENNIAYRGEGVVNWCPGCHTVIANEQVLLDGTCERSGDMIEKKRMPQWMLRITDFADALIDDLDTLGDWPEHIKEAQRQWIGRSEGAEIDFKLNVNGASSTVNSTITVFTTRPDTLFGATYLVLAPEHPFLEQNRNSIENWKEVATYVQTAKQKSEIERGDNTKEKTGVKLEAITATNPANGEEIPVYIADYVLAGYGTGAIMAVPGHDERDNEFAKKFRLPIKRVVEPLFIQTDGGNAFRETDPVEPRDAVCVVVRNPADNTYLALEWKKDQMHGLVTGGIDDGEDLIEAARREVTEETGYKNLKVVRDQNFSIHCKFWHRVKEVNRHARFTYVFFELENNERKVVSESEQALHDSQWISENDLDSFFTVFEAKFAVTLLKNPEYIHTGNGLISHSGEFDGMDSEAAKIVITEKVGGRMTNTYRLRDWSIGRQRYWGVPIPIVYDPQGKAHIVPKEHLPWTLPEDVDFTPTGEPPLAKSQELKERTEHIFGAGWLPEVETMDTFVDSSWYFLRYLDNHNDEEFASKVRQQEWMQVDMYFGGAEHTTMHLLYSRFWQKALHKLGLTVHSEPYKMRINRGLILGPDGNKMSKSKGNVVDPDEQVKLVGADTVKMYLAFMGPYQGANYPFDLGGIAGIRRFLERVYGLEEHLVEVESKETTVLLHKTIKKVGSDITEFKFNTAISALMILMNQFEKNNLSMQSYQKFLLILAPFAPHISEELWHLTGQSSSIHIENFPNYDPSLVKDEVVTIGVQINGKHRGEITIAVNATETEALNSAKGNAELAARLARIVIKKVVYVPSRILNIIGE
ncbi:MAG: class I tRNA ligase family protein [Patescibacteria group bacterium]